MNKNNIEREDLNNFKTIFRPFLQALKLGWKWERGSLIGLALLAILLGGSTYLQFASFSKIVDEIIRLRTENDTDYSFLITNSIFLLLTFFIPGVLRHVHQFLTIKSRFGFARKLSLHIAEKTVALDIATIESSQFQDLIVKANSRGHLVVYNVLTTALQNLENVASIIIASLFVISIAPILFVVALLTALPHFYFYKKYGLRVWWIHDFSPKRRRKYFNRMRLFNETHPITELKLFQLKNRFSSEVDGLLQEFDKDLLYAERSRFGYELGLIFLQIAGMGFAIYYLVNAGIVGTLAIGALLLAFNSYRGLYRTLEAFFLMLGVQDEAGKYAQWWFDIFSLKPKIVSNSEAVKPVWIKPPCIVFKKVSFKYEESDRFVLKDVSFTIESGEKLALVGLNGAGKTTLIKLLCRIYDPTKGKITVDGVDLATIDVDHWHTYLGILFQDFVHYNFTVAESIGLGRGNEPVDIARVKEAAQKATASGFIEEYPQKYDQLLWKGFEDGVEPSKGERQKIAVARIFYRDALITVLDEPTSAIDAPSEDKIFETLESMPKDRTAVLISHRISAIKNADKILVLNHGSISEIGSHEELMNQKGEYWNLYNTQAKRFLSEEIEQA